MEQNEKKRHILTELTTIINILQEMDASRARDTDQCAKNMHMLHTLYIHTLVQANTYKKRLNKHNDGKPRASHKSYNI